MISYFFRSKTKGFEFRKSSFSGTGRLFSGGLVLTGVLGLGALTGSAQDNVPFPAQPASQDQATSQDQAPAQQDQAPANAGDRSDGQIEMDVVHALDAAGQLKQDWITAATVQGEVTLSGTSGSEQNRQLAESIASKVPGVTKVVNSLKVGDPQSAEAQDNAGADPNQDQSPMQADNAPQAGGNQPGYSPNYPPPPPQNRAGNQPYGQQPDSSREVSLTIKLGRITVKLPAMDTIASLWSLRALVSQSRWRRAWC